MKKRRWPFWAAVLALGWFGISGLVVGGLILRAKAVQPPSGVVVEKDVVYRTVGGQELKMDIARPKAGEGPFPAILCIHGGGWQAGDKGSELPLLQGFAQQGYVAASVEYRLAPKTRFPAQIQDVKAAVQYLRGHAKNWRIDPDRIGVMGGSAGGHLALLLATTDRADGLDPPEGGREFPSSRVQAVVSIAGPTDLTKPYPAGSEYMVTDLIGQGREAAPALYEKASPLSYVSAGDSPIFMIHGTKDELVPYDQSTAMEAACKKAGVAVDLRTIPDGGHGSGGKAEDWAGAIVKSVEFFDRQLKPCG